MEDFLAVAAPALADREANLSRAVRPLDGMTTVTQIVLLLLAALPADENEESRRLAREWGGRVQVRMADGSWCDILTDSHAWEVEWAPKWKSGPGQATLYAILSGREPGVVLLLTPGADEKRYVLRCAAVCARLGIAFRTARISKR